MCRVYNVSGTFVSYTGYIHLSPSLCFPCLFFFFHLFLINFIFGCVGSSLLFEGFSQVVAGAAL